VGTHRRLSLSLRCNRGSPSPRLQHNKKLSNETLFRMNDNAGGASRHGASATSTPALHALTDKSAHQAWDTHPTTGVNLHKYRRMLHIVRTGCSSADDDGHRQHQRWTWTFSHFSFCSSSWHLAVVSALRKLLEAAYRPGTSEPFYVFQDCV
jgi:hypothetical protein